MSKSIEKAARAWSLLEKVIPLGPIRNEAHYRRVAKFLDELLTEVGGNEKHPMSGLLYTVGEIVREYELRTDPVPDVRGAEVVAFLMQSHKLSQSELPEIGPQSVVSDILSGERILNARMIGRLAARFKLPTDVFYGPEQYSNKPRRDGRSAASKK